MSGRPTLTPGALFRMLRAEFEARRPAACVMCRMPLPRSAVRTDEESANWTLEAGRECPHECAALIAELARELSRRYDMSDYASATQPAS